MKGLAKESSRLSDTETELFFLEFEYSLKKEKMFHDFSASR